MSARLIWCLAAAIIVAPVATRGKDGAEVALSRSYSAMHFMRTICPQYIRVDLDFADKTSAAILVRGNAELDKAAMQAAIVPEIKRRGAEVAATGEAAWCKSQRALMREIGLGKVFGE